MEEVKFGHFIWSSTKEKENIEKHGINFKSAIKAFADPKRQIPIDEAHSESEGRFFCIGLVGGRICTVRFVFRDGLVRIYGAGYWRKGRKFYEEERQG